MTDTDAALLRRAIVAARTGDAPFGAVVARDAAVLVEARNETRRRNDPTAHAEMLALREAGSASRGATLYASGEPCAMCAAAAVIAGIERIVFGLRERDIPRASAAPLPWARVVLPIEEVAARTARPLRVDGPWLEDEAAALWRPPDRG